MGYSHHILWDRNNSFHSQSYHKVFLSLFLFNNSQNNVYTKDQPHCAVINYDARPTIVDTLFTLIFMMKQGACHFLFFIYKWQILCLRLSTTSCPVDYPRYMTNNHWHSVDAHFQDGAWRVSQTVLIIKAARCAFISVSNLSTVWLPRTQDQKLLMLCWRSLECTE